MTSQDHGPGITIVDEVLADIEAIDARPLEEHVTVFESAHERLRSALDIADPA